MRNGECGIGNVGAHSRAPCSGPGSVVSRYVLGRTAVRPYKAGRLMLTGKDFQ